MATASRQPDPNRALAPAWLAVGFSVVALGLGVRSWHRESMVASVEAVQQASLAAAKSQTLAETAHRSAVEANRAVAELKQMTDAALVRVAASAAQPANPPAPKPATPPADLGPPRPPPKLPPAPRGPSLAERVGQLSDQLERYEKESAALSATIDKSCLVENCDSNNFYSQIKRIKKSIEESISLVDKTEAALKSTCKANECIDELAKLGLLKEKLPALAQSLKLLNGKVKNRSEGPGL